MDAEGEPVPLDNVRKALNAAKEAAGLARPLGLHTLRHTFAVTLAREGVPILKLSKVLGHANTRTTEMHYLRFYPDEGADATLAMPDLEGELARVEEVG